MPEILNHHKYNVTPTINHLILLIRLAVLKRFELFERESTNSCDTITKDLNGKIT
jgi:hypothetical protein